MPHHPAHATSPGSVLAFDLRFATHLSSTATVLRDALFEILRVRYQFHLASFTQYFQSIDRRSKLHPVVGCLCFASGQLAFLISVSQNASPTARTRIPHARTVRDQLNVRHCSNPFFRCGFGISRKHSCAKLPAAQEHV